MVMGRRANVARTFPAGEGKSRPEGGVSRIFLLLSGVGRVCLVGLCLFGGVFIGGCGPQPLSPAAVHLLESGIVAYDLRQDDRAIAELTEFLSEYRRTRRADEAWYYRGLAHMRGGDYAAARSDLVSAAEATAKPHIRSNALVALGDIAVQQDRPAEAMEWYVLALSHLTRGLAPRDRVLYTLGDLAQRQGQWREADRHFDQLIGDFSEFPASAEYVTRASQRTHGRCWTIRLGTFATRADAVTMAGQWAREDVEPDVWPAKTSAGLVFHVQAGRYDLHAHAVKAAQGLAEEMSYQIVVGR